MDQLLAPNQTQAQLDDAAVAVPQRDRRREKPHLSCTFCRRRKVRCDRQLPCNACISRGIAGTCTYSSSPQQKGTSTVGERIRELEALVRSLLQQQEQQQQQQQGLQTPAVSHDGGVLSRDSPTRSSRATPGDSPPGAMVGSGAVDSQISADRSIESMTVSLTTATSGSNSKDNAVSPAPSDHGTMRMNSYGSKYVSSVHWAAVLDSISELKDHYDEEEEAKMLSSKDQVPLYSPGPRLLYEPVQATKADILASIPARPIVDRLVARYFNQGVAPVILHSGQFLKEYESFWQDPTAAPFSWIGLLFSMMCFSLRCPQFPEGLADCDILQRSQLFHERTVHCLVLGHFTRGGPHVLETMLHHCGNELFLRTDADIGTWLLLGIVVQLATSMGYHRDPSNFLHISPFDGEMRRRVWASIMQMDYRLSGHMGLPRLIRLQTCDTAEPRNLSDMDFDEATVELPSSRPESELTPVLFSLARNRIDRLTGIVGDLVGDLEDHSYQEIMGVDKTLQEADASLPPIYRWQPLSQSFMVSPQIVLGRVWLQLAVQRLRIWLHRKYLAPSHSQKDCGYSREACLQAAIKILEFQQLLDEEMQPSGQLYPVRTMQSPLIQTPFLLGMSVLCYYLQLAKTTSDVALDEETKTKIYALLRNTYPMWLRSSAVSHDAREAADHLSVVLGLQDQEHEKGRTEKVAVDLVTSQNDGMSLDQVTWGIYQEYLSNFPDTFNTDFMTLDATDISTIVNTGDPVLGNTVDLD